jgi:hypothetical protein
MKAGIRFLAAALAFSAGAAASQPRDLEELERLRLRIVTQGPVCPDPARPCTISGGPFKPNELSFRAPRPFKFDRGEDRSQPFFAAILQSGPLCGIDESRRLRVQEQFPGRKVFVHRHFCEDFGDKVTYTNVDRKRGFLAVYAGANEEEARAFAEKLRASGAFPGANLRKMQAVVTWQLE